MEHIEPRVFDISPLDAVDRYPAILRHFDRIAPGRRLWIITDRDPGLFRRRLTTDRPDAFRWHCSHVAKGVWVVAIQKSTGAAMEGAGDYWREVTEPASDRLPEASALPLALPLAPSLYAQLRAGALG